MDLGTFVCMNSANSITVQMQRIEDDSLMVHYELRDDFTHVMNAKVEAESSLCCIKALNYVSKVLGVNNELQTGALKQGSVVKMFWFILDDKQQTPWIRFILILIFRKLFFEKKIVRMEDLTNGLTEQESKGVKAAIEKLGFDDKKLNRLNSHLHFRKARTEYFRQLSTCKEIKAVGIKHNEFDNLNTYDYRIESSLFTNYIETFVPETKTVEHAKVFIVSPVIVKGKSIKWKGTYERQDINFEIMAGQFKTEAQNAEVDFRTGSYIDCRLQFEETFDEDENPVHNGFKVLIVYGYGYDDNYIETLEGKKKKINDSQLTLFDNIEDW